MTNSQPHVPASTDCCTEYSRFSLSRRSMLTTAGLTAALGVFGDVHVRAHAAAYAAPGTTDLSSARDGGRAAAGPALVVLSLRGAADGASIVVPHGDPGYYKARPTIAVPAASLLVPDAMFGLHPKMAPLADWWRTGKLAAVHAAGLPAPNRSHFSAMEEIEDADPGSAARVGWLNRLLGGPAGHEAVLRAVNMGTSTLPTSLAGPAPVLSVSDPAAVKIAGEDEWDNGRRRPALKAMWRGNHGGTLSPAMNAIPDIVDRFETVENVKTTAKYPETDLGRALRHTSAVLRSGIGSQVLTVEHGGWDMHTGLGNLQWGDMINNVDQLATALAAFLADLGPDLDRTTVVVLSEFGRRNVENANAGLDHGYGNMMLLAGAGVQGGRVHGTWPGFGTRPDDDLVVTTDYRSVLTEVVTRRFGASVGQVFPGFTPAPVGVIA